MATKTPYNDYAEKTPKRFMGILTTKLVITEREPVDSANDGMTIGQLIDMRINDMQEQFNKPGNYPDGSPVMQSITFEFPE